MAPPSILAIRKAGVRDPAAAPLWPLGHAVREVPAPPQAERLFAHLASRRGCVWLDSAGGPAHLARWSVLAAEPSAVLVHQGGAIRLLSPNGRPLAPGRRNCFAAIRQALSLCRADAGEAAAAIPFGPGFYGYLAYDLAPHVEPKASLPPRRDIPLPDLWFGLYEAVLVTDRREGRWFLVGAEGPTWEVLQEALEASRCESPAPTAARTPRPASPAACNMTREGFLAAVARAREYIAAGDIFQVNLSRRYTVRRAPRRARPAAADSSALADLYLRLRRANPAPYAAYVGLDAGRAVLSSSPELFLDLRAGRVVTRPIKGTRPRRPGDETFNRRMRGDLAASEKDRAELIMIVDLERNDLGRVAAYGSVRVTEPRAIEAYEAVFHTVATVEGRLHPGRGVVDLLRATFPGGSVTGAPKVRAMQIIAELEPTRRSVYTGAVGYLGPPSAAEPQGRCALNIAIRTLLAAGGAVHLQVGGGIVADSDPAAEFDETADKARAMLAAFGLVP